MKFDKSMEPDCASAKPLQRRPHLSSPLLRVISKKGTHPGYAYRIKRWHRYQVGMSVLHCRETEGLDHLDVFYYERHGLMTLRPMTREELQEALRPWDDNRPTRSAVPSGAMVDERSTSGARKYGTQVETDKPETRRREAGTASLDRFAELVPSELLERSGEVFYSGRAAFSRPSLVYLLGFNPGSEPKPGPNKPKLRTVKENIEYVRQKPERFSLYYEPWEEGRTEAVQIRLRHLFKRTGLDPCLTPASNCVFVRSKGAKDLPDRRRLEEACWSFHQAVISELGVRLIVCLGKDALSAVSRQMGTGRQIDEHVEANKRAWASQVFENEGGMITIGLTHPSRTAWNRPASDPSPVVIRALKMLYQVHCEHSS